MACTSDPCENGATCVDVNVDTFVSVCRDGFFGVSCGDSKLVRIYIQESNASINCFSSSTRYKKFK